MMNNLLQGNPFLLPLKIFATQSCHMRTNGIVQYPRQNVVQREGFPCRWEDFALVLIIRWSVTLTTGWFFPRQSNILYLASLCVICCPSVKPFRFRQHCVTCNCYKLRVKWLRQIPCFAQNTSVWPASCDAQAFNTKRATQSNVLACFSKYVFTNSYIKARLMFTCHLTMITTIYLV